MEAHRIISECPKTVDPTRIGFS